MSVEALALASGSALAGAATMAVFVLGTSPLFALLGYAARRAATAWRGKLALVTGIAVVAMGLYTSPRRWSCGPKTLRVRAVVPGPEPRRRGGPARSGRHPHRPRVLQPGEVRYSCGMGMYIGTINAV